MSNMCRANRKLSNLTKIWRGPHFFIEYKNERVKQYPSKQKKKKKKKEKTKKIRHGPHFYFQKQ